MWSIFCGFFPLLTSDTTANHRAPVQDGHLDEPHASSGRLQLMYEDVHRNTLYHTCKQTDRQTDRQIDRQADRYVERQTDRNITFLLVLLHL